MRLPLVNCGRNEVVPLALRRLTPLMLGAVVQRSALEDVKSQIRVVES
jgi:hypothetical protein